MIINTRPQRYEHNMRAALKGATHEVVSSPLLVMKSFGIPRHILNDVDALIITSPAAVEVIAQSQVSRVLPVFAVGSDSAMAALAAGFSNTTNGGGTASKLLRKIDHVDFQNGLYVSARHVSRDLSEDLPERLRRHIAYEMVPANDFSSSALIALRASAPVIIPFYSPRSAQVFEYLFSKKELPFALSKATAVLIHSRLRKCLTLPWGCTHVAPTPDGAGMIAAIREAI